MLAEWNNLPLPAAFVLFAVSAVAVWLAGARLTYVVDELSDRRKLSKSLVGLLLLSTATSLPEIATTLGAAVRQSQELVLNNLYGGIALQTAILGVADFWTLRAITDYPRLMTHAIEATLLVLLLALSAVVIVFGEPLAFAGIGAGSLIIAIGYAMAIWFLRYHDPEHDWLPVELPEDGEDDAVGRVRDSTGATDRMLVVQSLLCSATIFVFGLVLVMLADTIAVRTGLGAGFIGATLLAGATSLPELSTSIAAIRMGAYTLAISNIFGSNLIMIVLVFPADALYRQGPLLSGTGPVSILALLFGILVTCIYLVGLIARRKPRVGRLGTDSVAVLVTFILSIFAYYFVS